MDTTIQKLSTKEGRYLFAAAFVGGMTLPILRIMHVMNDDPSHINIGYFFGLVSAGILGLVGHIFIGSTSMKSAAMDGIAAPTIIGNLLKSGVIVATAFFNTVQPQVYADSTCTEDTVNFVSIDTVNEDSIKRFEKAQEKIQQRQQQKKYIKSFIKAMTY